MKRKIAEKWVRALRNGKYKQGKQALRTNDKYCCLGVLCDLYRKEVKESGWDEDEKGPVKTFVVSDDEGDNETLPPTVQKWAGIDSDSGVFDDEDGTQKDLSELNDAGSTFKEIAKLIEANWKAL